MDLKNTLLIDAFNPEMKIIAHMVDGDLRKVYFDLPEREDALNNIYLGKVINVVNSLSAYFVDYGVEKNGFLSFNSCSRALSKDEMIMVQVSKNEKENKGAKLNSVIKLTMSDASLISDSLIDGHLKIRGEESKDDLLALWSSIRESAKDKKKPGLLHKEDCLVQKILNKAQGPVKIVVDGDAEFAKLKNLVQNVEKYSSTIPIFYQFGIAEDIKNLSKRSVVLEKGAVIVIDTAEAMCCIDVNSSSHLGNNLEETSLKVNLAAVDEAAKQIRLRDLSGIIAIDFIDMYNRAHVAEIEDRFALAMQNDTASIRIAKINEFGMLILSRQRSSLNMYDSLYTKCGTCGNGLMHRVQYTAWEILSDLRLSAHCNPKSEVIKVRCSAHVAEFLLNKLRRIICDLEDLGPRIQIIGDLVNSFEISPVHNFIAPKIERIPLKVAEEITASIIVRTYSPVRYKPLDIPLYRSNPFAMDSGAIVFTVD